jgi:hypothetical protein
MCEKSIAQISPADNPADMTLTLEISADTLAEILSVLTEIRRKIRQGKMEAADTFRGGSYSYEVEDWSVEREAS